MITGDVFELASGDLVPLCVDCGNEFEKRGEATFAFTDNEQRTLCSVQPGKCLGAQRSAKFIAKLNREGYD